MSKKMLISALVLFVLGAACQVQAVVTWDGDAAPGDNGWNRAENWDSDVVPGVSDDVVINMGTEEDECEIQLPQANFTIDSLDTDGYVGLGAWGTSWLEFTITNGFTNRGSLEIVTDGFIRLDADVTNTTGAFLELEAVEIVGIFTNEVDAAVEIWDEAGFNSGIDNYGTIEVDAFSEMWVEGTLYNNGLIQFLGGVAISEEDTLDNDGTIKGFGAIESEGTFINSGEIMAEGGVLNLCLMDTFETTGVLSNQFVSSLQIDTVADVNNLGTMYVRSGGGIAINNDLINRPGGVIELIGGTLATSSSIMQSSGATFSGFGMIASPNLTIKSGAEIELTGPTTIHSDVTIESGGTLIVRAGQTIITGATTNNGTILRTGGTILFQGGYSGSGENIEATNPSAVVVDNGDAGTSYSGTWNVSTVSGFYDTESLYTRNNGDEYNFEAWAIGGRIVSMWWTAHSGRLDNVSVKIYDGSTLLDTVTVNQKINGSQWNELGYYTFTDKAKVTVVSLGSGVSVADAVKFGSTDEIVIDNGDAGTSSSGTWIVSGVAGFYDSDSLYSKINGSSYSFESSVQGSRNVYLWWTAHSGRSNPVSVEIYDGNTIDTVTVNQQSSGGQWNLLGTYSFGGTAKVKILSSGSGATVADAVKISPF